ncbi:MAG: KDO2-lipid IV(A) lauroyltransferase [Paraglaciecola psychrophila]|jgi:KDO2-lipid IV(A) lauroyltransferase
MKKIKQYLLHTVLRMLALLSLSLAATLGRLIGAGLWRLNGRARSISEINLALCLPELSNTERALLARQSLAHLGTLALELGGSWCWPSDDVLGQVVEVEGLQLMTAAQDSGRPVVVLAPHLGNWEVLGLYMAQHFAVTALYQPPALEAMDTIMYSARSRNGSTLVPTNLRGVKALLKALGRGEVTVILPDQVPARNGGEFAPFFGIDTLTATLPLNLIERTAATVVVAAMLRLEGGGYRLLIRSVDEAIYGADRAAALAAMNAGVEALVREAPQQYQWEYKRFRRLAPGLQQPYKDSEPRH